MVMVQYLLNPLGCVRVRYLIFTLILLLTSYAPRIHAQALVKSCEGLGGEALAICQERAYQQLGVRILNQETNTECNTSGSVVLVGKDNQEKVYNFFVAQGLTPAQASGIVGNFMVESTPLIDPRADSGVFKGIAQWNNTRWQPLEEFARSINADVYELSTQLQFVMHEFNTTEKAAYEDLKKQTTARDAAISFDSKYERSSAGRALRISHAEAIFAYYGSSGNTTPTAQGGNSQTNSCAPATGGGSVVDGFVVYNQYDPKWANKPYGQGDATSTIAKSGCGPSSVAMVVATLVDPSVNPETIASKYGQYYISGQGSSWGLMDNAPKDYGLKSTQIGADMEAAKTALRSNKLIIASGKGPKPFTNGGHILVLRGITDSGKLLIGDSGHRDTSTVEHEEAALAASIVNMWVIEKSGQ